MPIDIVTTGLKMLGVLVLMIGVMATLNIYARRMMHRRAATAGGSRIRVMESAFLGAKKRVTLVEVPGAVLVLGVSADRIDLLDKIPEHLMRVGVAEKPTQPDSTFQSRLSRMIQRMSASTAPESKGGQG